MIRCLLLLVLIVVCRPLVGAEDDREMVVIPLVARDGIFACSGSIDGHAGWLIIDSGSTTTCLFPPQVRSHRYRYRRVHQESYTANGISVVHRVVRAATVRVGGVAYVAHDLAVLPAGFSPTTIGLLGCDFLTANRAAIDIEHRQLILHVPHR